MLNFDLFCLKMVCFLGSADGKVFLYDFVFGDIMLFGSVYCITIIVQLSLSSLQIM